jgi:hypothetical protein
MNVVDLCLSILAKQQLRRRVHHDVCELIAAIESYTDGHSDRANHPCGPKPQSSPPSTRPSNAKPLQKRRTSQRDTADDAIHRVEQLMPGPLTVDSSFAQVSPLFVCTGFVGANTGTGRQTRELARRSVDGANSVPRSSPMPPRPCATRPHLLAAARHRSEAVGLVARWSRGRWRAVPGRRDSVEGLRSSSPQDHGSSWGSRCLINQFVIQSAS